MNSTLLMCRDFALFRCRLHQLCELHCIATLAPAHRRGSSRKRRLDTSLVWK